MKPYHWVIQNCRNPGKEVSSLNEEHGCFQVAATQVLPPMPRRWLLTVPIPVQPKAAQHTSWWWPCLTGPNRHLLPASLAIWRSHPVQRAFNLSKFDTVGRPASQATLDIHAQCSTQRMIMVSPCSLMYGSADELLSCDCTGMNPAFYRHHQKINCRRW